MPKKDNLPVQLGKYYGLIFVLPAAVLVGYGIGYALDKVFHTGFLKVVFLLLGVAAGMIDLFRELTKDDAGKMTPSFTIASSGVSAGSSSGARRRGRDCGLGLEGRSERSRLPDRRSDLLRQLPGLAPLADALGPNPRKPKPALYALRMIALVAGAWVIIKFLGLNLAAAALGLLVSGAAVVLEIVYELIYAS